MYVTTLRKTFLLIVAGMLAACASTSRDPATMTAATTVDSFDLQTASAGINQNGYQIGASDLLKVTVFQVPDLSFDQIRVDASGSIEFPLIGSVRAAGRTPTELSRELQDRLGARFLQTPQVTVIVSEAASQKVTVDGAVKEPGVYVMKGRTTLLQAVAMARGASPVSNLRSVAVFRTVDGERMVAVFDLAAIRAAEAIDPVLQGDDIVVVDTSRLSAVLRDTIAALPAFAVFFLR